MTIDNYEFQNIKSFLKENNFILSNDLPRKVGYGQSNPTYILTDNDNKKFPKDGIVGEEFKAKKSKSGFT